MAQLDANGHPTLGTLQPGDANDPGYVPGTSGSTSTSTGSSGSTGNSAGQSHSSSYIPQYDPQLGFLTQYGNLAGRLGAQQYGWANNEFQNNSDLTTDNVNNYLRNSDMAGTAAQRDYANYNDTFNPAMGALVDDARSYASPERVSSEMGRSEAGVAQNFDAQRKNLESSLKSFGVNPSDPRYAGQMAASRTAQAASEAGAGTQARLATEQTGRDLRSQVLQQANLLPGQTATEQNVAMQGATGAENAALGNTSEGALTLGTTKDYLGAGVANNKFQPLGTTSNSFNTSSNSSHSNNNSNSNSVSMGIAPAPPHSTTDGPVSNGNSSTFAKGGAIPDDQGGGYVPRSMSPSGGARTDDIPATIPQSGGQAQINAGEFVVPKDVVEWHGHKFFQDLIQKSRKMRQANPGPAHPQTHGGVQHAVLGGPMGGTTMNMAGPTTAIPDDQGSTGGGQDFLNPDGSEPTSTPQPQPQQQGMTGATRFTSNGGRIGPGYVSYGGGPLQGPAQAPAAPAAPAPAAPAATPAPTAQTPDPAATPIQSTVDQTPAPEETGSNMDPAGPADTGTGNSLLPTIANYNATGNSWRPQQPSTSALGSGNGDPGTSLNMSGPTQQGQAQPQPSAQSLGEFHPQRSYYSPNRMSLTNPSWTDVHAGDGSSGIPGGPGGPTSGPQQGIPSGPSNTGPYTPGDPNSRRPANMSAAEARLFDTGDKDWAAHAEQARSAAQNELDQMNQTFLANGTWNAQLSQRQGDLTRIVMGSNEEDPGYQDYANMGHRQPLMVAG